jgi:hypothetical protein
MLRLLRPPVFAAVVASTATALASLAGCATAALERAEPEADPTLPMVEAPNDPRPADPMRSEPVAEPTDDASTGDDDEDGGSTVVPPDAAEPVQRPAQGEVLITEVLYDPSGPEPASEWLEVYNGAGGPRSLAGLTLVDGAGRKHTIGSGVVLAEGAYALLVRSEAGALAAKAPAGAILYEYGAGLTSNAGILLANGASGGIRLLDGATVIAEAPYGGWFSQPSPGGRSVQLKALTFAAGAEATSWCLSTNAWTSGADRGTPGAPSDCP